MAAAPFAVNIESMKALLIITGTISGAAGAAYGSYVVRNIIRLKEAAEF
jgi:hypothetical protein